MRKITILFIVSVFTLTLTAQNCDSTRLFSEAIKRSIHYSDSMYNIDAYPSPSEGIIDTSIYTEFFRDITPYFPEKVGKYTIHKVSETKIKKNYQKNYQNSTKNNIKNYALYSIAGGLDHFDKKRIGIFLSFGKKITEIEYDTMNVKHEIFSNYSMQRSVFIYKYDCDKRKFNMESENHVRGGLLTFKKDRYRQDNKSLYKNSLELFIDTLAQLEHKTGTINISSSYLLYEPKVDTSINNEINGINVDFLFIEKEQYYYTNRIPFKSIDYVIWECNGQLVYTIYYKKHKKAFMQKNIVEKFLYTGNYYYQFNCKTEKWELVRTEFLKPNKRVKWK